MPSQPTSLYFILPHLASLSFASGVYGYYKDTSFTIVAGPVGGLTPLPPGTTLKSSGYPSFECSKRDERGVCDPSVTSRKVMAAYFSINAPQDNNSVVLSVWPSCNQIDYSQCPPGCDCNPFSVYTMLCSTDPYSGTDHCTSTDRHAKSCYLSSSQLLPSSTPSFLPSFPQSLCLF
jgi:hypothetical protein